MIYRLDPDDARRQATWVAVGLGVVRCDADLAPLRLPRLERYKYLFGVAAIVLLLLPSLPGLGHEVNGVQLWVKVGPLQFQPGELAKIFLIVFLAALPARQARGARAGTAQGPRAAARDLGCGDARARPDERPRLGAAQLRDLPRDALRRRPGARCTSPPASRSSSAAPRRSTTRSTACSSASLVWLHPWTDERVHCTVNGGSTSARTATRTSSSRASTRSRTAATAAPVSGAARSRRSTARSSSRT